MAQFLVSDEEWTATLEDLRRALGSGGTLAFETRDPGAREWERWNPIESHTEATLPDGRVVHAWTEVMADEDGVVAYTHDYAFPEGEELQSAASLRFRTEEELRRSLRHAGFTVEAIHGGWGREPLGSGDGEFLVIARVNGRGRRARACGESRSRYGDPVTSPREGVAMTAAPKFSHQPKGSPDAPSPGGHGVVRTDQASESEVRVVCACGWMSEAVETSARDELWAQHVMERQFERDATVWEDAVPAEDVLARLRSRRDAGT